MEYDGDGTDEGPPAKRQRSTESLDTTMLSASEDLPMNGHDTAMDTQTTDDLGSDAAALTPVVTPRKRGRPPRHTPIKPPATPSTAAQPSTTHLTPLKAVGPHASTPGRTAADRSARKKTARALFSHVAADDNDDDDDTGAADQDEDLARAIFGDTSDEDDDEDDNDGVLLPTPAGTDTPTKTKKKQQQRATRKRAKSPTPPRDLPPHETYFFHNKPGRPKTSDNTLAGRGLRLLTHDEYFAVLARAGGAAAAATQRHAAGVANLEALHAESFAQWAFELAQGFSVCLYGFGSKRALLTGFAGYLHARAPADTRVVVVNGYAPTANMRDVLACVAAAVLPAAAKKRTTTTTNHHHPLPSLAQPLAAARAILAHLSATPSASLVLLVHSVDGAGLRRAAGSPYAVLAALAAHPAVHLACSADAPDFPLLWDVGARSAFNFVLHDATTFAPLAGGAELDPVGEVHELLGRTARRVHGREGVAFVLRSLPENARNLFRLLVGEVLVAMDEDATGGAGAEGAAGVEYRMVYNKAVEEFVCSSEMAFRTLLKEFHDHQIITSRKDALGTELLSLPFGREELEAILEDLMA